MELKTRLRWIVCGSKIVLSYKSITKMNIALGQKFYLYDQALQLLHITMGTASVIMKYALGIHYIKEKVSLWDEDI